MTIKLCFLVGIFLLLGTRTFAWEINLNKSTIKVHIDGSKPVQFITDLPATSASHVEITAESSDTNVATVSLPTFHYDKIQDGVWKDFVNVTGVFLGKAKFSISIIHNGVKI